MTKTKSKPLTAKQRGKSANSTTSRAKKADVRARKTEPTANARTPVKEKTKPAVESGRPDGLRTGSKQAVMLDLALAEGGATEKAICTQLGWKKCRVTLKRVCDKVGAKLTSAKSPAGETVWQARMS